MQNNDATSRPLKAVLSLRAHRPVGGFQPFENILKRPDCPQLSGSEKP